MTHSLAGTVAPPDRRRQLDRCAGLGGAARGARPGPGQDQGVLAFEEPMTPDAASGAPLRRELSDRVDLDSGRLGPGRASATPATVTTTGAAAASCAPAAGSTAPNQMTVVRGDRRIPAIPLAARPCGRTDDAGNRNSWASLV